MDDVNPLGRNTSMYIVKAMDFIWRGSWPGLGVAFPGHGCMLQRAGKLSAPCFVSLF
jgi:hypothetical protein